MPTPTRAKGLRLLLRVAALVFRNEFLLLTRDRSSLFMLFLAPVVIIAVAGFSLGNLYGAGAGTRVYLIALLDQDHGAVADALVEQLKRDPGVHLERVASLEQARMLMIHRALAPLAILIPPDTTTAFKAGRPVDVEVYVDPIRRIEASAIELRLDQLLRRVTAAAHDQARIQLAAQSAELHLRLTKLTDRAKILQSDAASYQHQLEHQRRALSAELEDRIRQGLEDLQAQTHAAIERSTTALKSGLEAQLAPRRQALDGIAQYLHQLQASERDFNGWLDNLKAQAGSYATQIPPPPSWPAPPSAADLAELSKPLTLPSIAPTLPDPAALKIAIPQFKLPPMPSLALDPGDLLPDDAPSLPGSLGLHDRTLSADSTAVNTFDQYVPGFGITFLLVDMLWGVAVGLIDERDWGTLERLRASGAPVPGILVGKLMARFLIGLIQLIVLFAVGWLLFGITLGHSPAMLLLPAAAISFAAAAVGLVIACLARSHDSVMPIGAVTAMTMSAIGGCWWPLDFEPAWMRAVAQWVPTTWTMRAFNDLMIRGLGPASALAPTAITIGLGLLCLAVGILGSWRLYE